MPLPHLRQFHAHCAPARGRTAASGRNRPQILLNVCTQSSSRISSSNPAPAHPARAPAAAEHHRPCRRCRAARASLAAMRAFGADDHSSSPMRANPRCLSASASLRRRRRQPFVPLCRRMVAGTARHGGRVPSGALAVFLQASIHPLAALAAQGAGPPPRLSPRRWQLPMFGSVRSRAKEPGPPALAAGSRLSRMGWLGSPGWSASAVALRLSRSGRHCAAHGYRRFRCRDCGRQFNERSGGVLNRT